MSQSNETDAKLNVGTIGPPGENAEVAVDAGAGAANGGPNLR